MLKYYDFSGVSFLVDKRFKCEIASENASARFDLVHNPTVPYLTDSKFTPFSAPSRDGLYGIHRIKYVSVHIHISLAITTENSMRYSLDIAPHAKVAPIRN